MDTSFQPKFLESICWNPTGCLFSVCFPLIDLQEEKKKQATILSNLWWMENTLQNTQRVKMIYTLKPGWFETLIYVEIPFFNREILMTELLYILKSAGDTRRLSNSCDLCTEQLQAMHETLPDPTSRMKLGQSPPVWGQPTCSFPPRSHQQSFTRGTLPCLGTALHQSCHSHSCATEEHTAERLPKLCSECSQTKANSDVRSWFAVVQTLWK